MNWAAVASLVAALAAAAGVVFTGLSLQTTRAQNAVTEQGQLTDRYGKAVDHLDRTGPEHLQARLGAIYALERLARDSPRDHPTIVEVLSAFIRTTTPQPGPGPAGRPSATTCPPQTIAPDIQAALTVLERRDTTQDRTTRVDLHSTCLAGATLTGANLVGVNLANANLTNANLVGADLGDATLRNADLTNAVLNQASLDGAFLMDATLTKTRLHSATLRGADLRGATLTQVDLGAANLDRAILSGANLGGAYLGHAYLGGAYLDGVNLCGTDLRGAILRGSNLEGANHDQNTAVSGVVIDEHTTGAWW